MRASPNELLCLSQAPNIYFCTRTINSMGSQALL
jgi:hypothetical protein